MQLPKLLVQAIHRLGMRPDIIALLPIPHFLALPLPHDLCRSGPHDQPVCSAHSTHRSEAEELLSCACIGDADADADAGAGARQRRLGRVGQSEQRREAGLHGEVDGEERGLQGGKLWPGQRLVGDYAGDEGVEDLGAEEEAVAGKRN